MKLLYTTFGFTTNLALAPLREGGYKEVHIFHGTNEAHDTKNALYEAKMVCKTLGVKMITHGIRNPFDYEEILAALNHTYRRHRGKEVTLNASGGTRPMIMAATIFAFTQDVPTVYYDDYQTQEGRSVPLKAYRGLRNIGSSQRHVLTYLRDKGPQDIGALTDALGLAMSTLSVHVHRLQRNGFVTIEREGKRKIVTALPEIERMELEAEV